MKKGKKKQRLTNKIKVGIFGGTFDPPTWGHESVIASALYEIDEVWVMPCYTHSYDKTMSMPHYRLEMCKIAFGDMKRVMISDFQIKNKMAGDTSILMKDLQKNYPMKDFVVVIGEDNARTIQRWVEYKKLIKNYDFLAVGRKTRERINIKKDKRLKWMASKANGRSHRFVIPVQQSFPEDCSSTKARKLIDSVKDVKAIRSKLVEYIHFDVISYIHKYNIYYSELTNKRLKIGLDLHGVILDHPDFFAVMSQMLVMAGHEVHILTGAHITNELLKNLKKCGIMYTHLFSIADTYRNNSDVNFRYDKKGSPWMDTVAWNKAKGLYSSEYKLDMHIDDTATYGKYFETPFCLWKGGKDE